MWWEQQWHVWAGLCLSVIGIAVSVFAWVSAALAQKAAGQARDKADEAVEDLAAMKDALESRLAQEKLVRSTPPVAVDQPNFFVRSRDHGWFRIDNLGPGTAYNMAIAPATPATHLSGHLRWGTFTSEHHGEFQALFDPGIEPYASIRISWKVDATDEIYTSKHVLENAKPLY